MSNKQPKKPFQNNARKRAGRCYELAWRGVMNADDVQLVHGYLHHPCGMRIGHAWIAGNDFIYDPVMDEFFKPGEYHPEMPAVALYVYTQLEAAKLALKEDSYGPWEEATRSLAHLD